MYNGNTSVWTSFDPISKHCFDFKVKYVLLSVCLFGYSIDVYLCRQSIERCQFSICVVEIKCTQIVWFGRCFTDVSETKQSGMECFQGMSIHTFTRHVHNV